MQWWQGETARQLIATSVMLTGLLVPGDTFVKFLATWSTYALVYLALTWLAVRLGGMSTLVAMARRSLRLSSAEKWVATSPARIAQGAAAVAMVAVAVVMPRPDQHDAAEALVVAVCLVAVVVSWLMLQVGFLMTYVGVHSDGGGLVLPDGAEPGITDFAYFTVAVGTTFGTTDIEVHRSALRRQVLAHGLLAFVFNTLVLTVAITFTTNYVG